MERYWNPMVPELTVTHFDASLEFYCELLGFTIRYRRENPAFAYIENERVHLMLEQNHDQAWVTDRLQYPLGRGVNFQIELTDISPILMRLEAAEVSLYRHLHESWYDEGDILSGQREFLVQDPDGYLLRFGQYLGERHK